MNNPDKPLIALITGAARRIGAQLARDLHADAINIVLHYRSAAAEATRLAAEFNERRPFSCIALQADLNCSNQRDACLGAAMREWGGLDILINNASGFYPTPLGSVSERDWDDLLGCNLKAPFFLAQAAAPRLRERGGCILNIVDIHAERGLAGYPVYSIAKAGLAAMTRVLAKELGPEIRVNGIAPGAILWPSPRPSPEQQEAILSRIPLRRRGEPSDIARAALFLIREAPYITGQILNVDGGRSLFT